MRSFSFFLTAVIVGLGGGVVAFRALAPSAWTAAVDRVESARTQWARSASPFDPPSVEAPLSLKPSARLSLDRATRPLPVVDTPVAGIEALVLRADLTVRGLETGSLHAVEATAAGRPAVTATTQAGGSDDTSAQWQGMQPAKVPLARHLRSEAGAAMLPADAKGQPIRTEQEVANLGPQDLALGFFPGSRLQPGQSLRSFDPRMTTTSVTLAAHAPLSEVAAFYRSQFAAGGAAAFKEHRAGPGELAFSDAGSSSRGDRRAYLFQNGDTVLITLVRTQPGIVR